VAVPFLVQPVLSKGSLSHRAQPTLEADGLTLRPWERGDVDALIEAYADPAIQQWHGRSMDEHEAPEWIEERAARWVSETGVEWAVVEGGSLVGRVGFRALELFDGLGEAGYWTLPSARGRGIAGRALGSASSWMLDELGFHRLELKHAIENAPSCRVAERAGYRLEGTERQAVLHPDGWHDMHVHVRIEGDPEVAAV
jgi:[ribosomal protein S5]-alanine N-acetyltransferase